MSREQQLEKTKTTIMEAARELFLTEGYVNTSTRDIAKAAGLTQPALYHHFSDKELIFVAVIKTVGSEVQAGLMKEVAAAKADPTRDPVETLLAMAKVLTTAHPRDVFTVIHSSFKYLRPENQGQLGMLFGRDYLAPITAFFSLEQAPLRSGVTPEMAAEFFLTSLSPMFNAFHKIGGPDMSKEDSDRMLINMIVYGLVQ